MEKVAHQPLEEMTIEELRTIFESLESVKNGQDFGVSNVQGRPEERAVLLHIIKGHFLERDESAEPACSAVIAAHNNKQPPQIPHSTEQINAAEGFAKRTLAEKFGHIKGSARVKLQRALFHQHLANPSGT